MHGLQQVELDKTVASGCCTSLWAGLKKLCGSNALSCPLTFSSSPLSFTQTHPLLPLKGVKVNLGYSLFSQWMVESPLVYHVTLTEVVSFKNHEKELIELEVTCVPLPQFSFVHVPRKYINPNYALSQVLCSYVRIIINKKIEAYPVSIYFFIVTDTTETGGIIKTRGCGSQEVQAWNHKSKPVPMREESTTTLIVIDGAKFPKSFTSIMTSLKSALTYPHRFIITYQQTQWLLTDQVNLLFCLLFCAIWRVFKNWSLLFSHISV